MKNHSVGTEQTNFRWVRSMSCYGQCFFGAKGFKYETFCEGWEKVSLCKKSGNQCATEPRPSKKTVEELNFNVNLEVGDLVAAVYQPTGRVCISKVIALNDKKVHISFLEYEGSVNEKSLFQKLFLVF